MKFHEKLQSIGITYQYISDEIEEDCGLEEVTKKNSEPSLYYRNSESQQGTIVKTSLKSLELARKEKGPMSSKNLSYSIQNDNKEYELNKMIITAIKNNAEQYLNPPIKNIGYKGILKASEEIKQWYRNSKNLEYEFKTTAMLMEKGGTGSALFRNLYRDFLKESNELLKIQEVDIAYRMFAEIAPLWTKISDLFAKTADMKSIEYINQAAEILIDLSQKEKKAMELLLNIEN